MYLALMKGLATTCIGCGDAMVAQRGQRHALALGIECTGGFVKQQASPQQGQHMGTECMRSKSPKW